MRCFETQVCSTNRPLWSSFVLDRAGKKLSDPDTRICPTRKKPGTDTFFVSEFVNRTIGHVRIENRVGSGFGKPGPGCPDVKAKKKLSWAGPLGLLGL